MDLWTAVLTGNLPVVKQHIQFGSDLNAKEPQRGSNPLIITALTGNTEIMKLLIDAGADINAVNNDGSTALHTAAFLCQIDCVRILLENGAKTELRNNFGRTPLESVSSPWSPEVEGIYKMMAGALQIEMDMGYIRETRPKVAELIRQYSNA